jgi:hypothetical protein
MSGKAACATCCAIYSVMGIILLGLFGLMFQKGAISFAILAVKSDWEAEQKAQACFTAAGLYAITLVVSIVAKIVLSRKTDDEELATK